MYFQIHLSECKNPELTAEMILINPSPMDNSRDRSVGIELNQDCNVGVYVEPIDYYSSSLLE